MESLKLKIYRYDSGKKVLVPFIEGKIPAGFPSPAQDYQEDKIDLNEQLIKHPSSTFIIKVIGDSMIEEGICNKSFLIVDRSLEYKKNSIAVVNINGDYTVKKIEKKNNKFFLTGANKNFAPIELNEETEILIFGIVTWVLNPKY
ncbi:MAG: translesion error-prone DNA polymerase V autoproteolytic subunit [Ignavibacteria bacterium]|nr:translesion error-prone DNA polymerase V autoproteolytic subunit [Ignavibacteria bacterium]